MDMISFGTSQSCGFKVTNIAECHVLYHVNRNAKLCANHLHPVPALQMETY